MVRNSDGVVVGLMHKCWKHISDPNLAKLLCIWEALSWIKQHYNGNLILEFDSWMAISNVNSHGMNDFYFGSFMLDCNLYRECFSDLKFCFAKRSANGVVHCLAKTTHSMPDYFSWELVVPDFLLY